MKTKIKAIFVILKVAYRSIKKVIANKKFKERDSINGALNVLIYQIRRYYK